MPPPGYESRFISEYTVTDILGEGGFGCVFEAENRYDETKYAVKRIPVQPGGDTLDKALGEVRAMAQLRHPNIVGYNNTWVEKPPHGWQSDADEEMLCDINWWCKSMSTYDDDCVFIYIQMQLCKQSLDKWLRINGTQFSRPLPRMKSWFRQIVSAAAYIHEKGLIHRDLKPSNILFVDDDHLQLCDLGIVTERAVIGGEEISVTRTCIGTKLYMSPEQRVKKRPRYSSMTDVFTLGLIFAELCVAMAPKEHHKFIVQSRKGIIAQDIITDPALAEFLGLLLRVEPENRLSCNEILKHPFLA